jgi:hypothetical protein
MLFPLQFLLTRVSGSRRSNNDSGGYASRYAQNLDDDSHVKAKGCQYEALQDGKNIELNE